MLQWRIGGKLQRTTFQSSHQKSLCPCFGSKSRVNGPLDSSPPLSHWPRMWVASRRNRQNWVRSVSLSNPPPPPLTNGICLNWISDHGLRDWNWQEGKVCLLFRWIFALWLYVINYMRAYMQNQEFFVSIVCKMLICYVQDPKTLTAAWCVIQVVHLYNKW